VGINCPLFILHIQTKILRRRRKIMIDTIYDEIVLLCKKMNYRDKLRLAQLLIQLARKEEEEIANNKSQNVNQENKNKETEVVKNKKSENNVDKFQYIIDRLKKSQPKKLNSLQNFITSMFQFRGGISNLDRDKIISELQKNKVITIDSNNKVTY
jgi:hypothetical protein